MLRRSFSLRAGLLALTLAGLGACGKAGEVAGPNTSTTNLSITNNTDFSVWYVRVRACGTQAWGEDMLGSNIISVGDTESFSVTPGCKDVKLSTKAEIGLEVIWTDVTISSGQTVSRTISAWN